MPVVNYEQYLNMMKDWKYWHSYIEQAFYDYSTYRKSINRASSQYLRALLMQSLTVSFRFPLAVLNLHPVLT